MNAWKLKSLFALLLVLSSLALTSCATTEADGENASARPWNEPKGWENGLPSGLTEGRYGR